MRKVLIWGVLIMSLHSNCLLIGRLNSTEKSRLSFGREFFLFSFLFFEHAIFSVEVKDSPSFYQDCYQKFEPILENI